MKEIRYKYEKRIIQLFYHFGLNNPFDKHCAFEYLITVNPETTINAVRDTLERVILGKEYLEEDTYSQWYWQKHFKGVSTPYSFKNKTNSLTDVFTNRDILKGTDIVKNYYRFSHVTANNLINDFEIEVDNKIKKDIIKGFLLKK